MTNSAHQIIGLYLLQLMDKETYRNEGHAYRIGTSARKSKTTPSKLPGTISLQHDYALSFFMFIQDKLIKPIILDIPQSKILVDKFKPY